MFELTILLCLVAIGWHIWSAQGVQEIAHLAAKRHCQQMEVQLLDDTVAVSRFWLKRDARGQFRVWRTYLFEFTSTGDERYQGRVVTLGSQVEAVQLQTHRLH